MKTLKAAKIIIVLLLTLSLSCSNQDDSPQVTTPTVSYSNTITSATFFQNGNTPAPTVNWNGNQGTFSMANSINGLSIDANTGVVSWIKTLPPGNHDIQVIASNSAGQSSNTLTIENPLQGLFVGNYNGSAYLDVDFSADGTVALTADDATAAPQFTGTWLITGNEILVNWSYNPNPTTQYSIKGDIVQSNASATYSGILYSGYDAVVGNEAYTFSVLLN